MEIAIAEERDLPGIVDILNGVAANSIASFGTRPTSGHGSAHTAIGRSRTPAELAVRPMGWPVWDSEGASGR